MARIRSIHPGQWTDEEFVSVSFAARLLAIGLRNEADDQGVFEWKPLRLKMQLFPADVIDVAELLRELVAANIIQCVERSSRKYGLIRNFRRWQRPEKPNAVYPLDDCMREYVGLSPTIPRPVDDQSTIAPPSGPPNSAIDPTSKTPQSAIAPPLNEPQSPTDRQPFDDQSGKVVSEVGGRRKEEEEKAVGKQVAASGPPPEPPRDDDQAALALIEAAEGVLLEHFGQRRPRHHAKDLPLARSWVERDISPSRLAAILDKAIIRFRENRPNDRVISLNLFTSDVDREEPPSPYPPGVRAPDDRRWFDRVSLWQTQGSWFAANGKPPNDPATLVPDHVLAAAGLARRKAPAPRQVPQSASA